MKATKGITRSIIIALLVVIAESASFSSKVYAGAGSYFEATKASENAYLAYARLTSCGKQYDVRGGLKPYIISEGVSFKKFISNLDLTEGLILNTEYAYNSEDATIVVELKYKQDWYNIGRYDVDNGYKNMSYMSDDQYEYLEQQQYFDLRIGCKKNRSEYTRIYARFAREYEIKYELNGGKFKEKANYTYAAGMDYSVPEPVRAGYVFEGWTGTGLKEKTKNLVIKNGNKENKTYTANWSVQTAASLVQNNNISGEWTKYYNITNIDLFNSENVEYDYNYDMYAYSGRLENAEKNKAYNIAITTEKPIYIVEYIPQKSEKIKFNCEYTNDEDLGYSYLYEENEETLYDLGILVSATYNEDGYAYSYGAGCIKYSEDYEDESYYGRKILSLETNVKKDKKYYFVVRNYSDKNKKMELNLIIQCGHENVELQNRTITSCEQGGYTGDVYCKDCGQLVSEGKNIVAGSEHDIDSIGIDATCTSYYKNHYFCHNCDYNYDKEYAWSGYAKHNYELEGYVAPTCTTSGKSGTCKCTVCGHIKYEDHELKAYHDVTDSNGKNNYYTYDYSVKTEGCMVDGYTGDYECRYCGEILEKGHNITATGHKFVDGHCEKCGIEENLLPIDGEGYYEISSFEDLKLFAENIEYGIKGRLTKDIIVSDDETDWSNSYMYDSLLDGDGHTIKNWNVNTFGSFFVRCRNSVIKNITMEAKGTISNDGFGVIALSANNCEFDNITINGNIEIKNICSEYNYGALIGTATDSKIINCVNNANMIVKVGIVGGIVGQISGNSLIKNCINNGSIGGDSIKNRRVGGIAGVASVNTKKAEHLAIVNCTNKGKIYYNRYSAGIVAQASDITIAGCINNVKISGWKYVANILSYGENISDKWFDDNTSETPTDRPNDETTTNKPNNETTANKNVSNNKTTTSSIKKPNKVKIKSAKNVKSKKIKLTWKKEKGVKGYRIRYSTNKKFKKAKTINVKNNKTSVVIKKLKKKKYYIQVCAYKKVKSKTYYGKWSKIKTIKVRK